MLQRFSFAVFSRGSEQAAEGDSRKSIAPQALMWVRGPATFFPTAERRESDMEVMFLQDGNGLLLLAADCALAML
jgi:hypothetical protein